MSKTRSEYLESLQNQSSCIFIGDKSKMLFHRKGCPCVNTISKNDLHCCGNNPLAKGFQPCELCKPKPLSKPSKDLGLPRAAKAYKSKNQVPIKPKSQVIQDAMKSIAAQYEMHLEFIGPNVYVTTIAGEWHFDYNTRPIVLHHKNEEKHYNHDGRLKGHYHIQKSEFSSPMLALAYIYQHEEAAIRRAFQLETPDDQQTSRRERIQAALDIASGKKATAAKILGISTSTLWRWRKKYGIQ